MFVVRVVLPSVSLITETRICEQDASYKKKDYSRSAIDSSNPLLVPKLESESVSKKGDENSKTERLAR